MPVQGQESSRAAKTQKEHSQDWKQTSRLVNKKEIYRFLKKLCKSLIERKASVLVSKFYVKFQLCVTEFPI